MGKNSIPPGYYSQRPPNFMELLFQKYLEQIYPGQTLPPTQVLELKNAFFAAGWAVLHEVSEVSSKMPEHLAMLVLSSMERECKKHAGEAIDRMYRNN